jgi:tetratricopeptide (TPR) repeat protein
MARWVFAGIALAALVFVGLGLIPARADEQGEVCNGPTISDPEACHFAEINCGLKTLGGSNSHAAFDACMRRAVRGFPGSGPDRRADLRGRCTNNAQTESSFRASLQACTTLISMHDGTPQKRSQYYLYRSRARMMTTNGLGPGFTAGMDDLTSAIQNDPENALAYMMRGMGYKATGRYALALADFNRAADIFERQNDNANEARTLFARGQMERDHMGDAAKGNLDMQQARVLDPGVDQSN